MATAKRMKVTSWSRMAAAIKSYQSTLQALVDGHELPAVVSERIRDNYEFFREQLAEVDPDAVYKGFGRLVVVDVTLDRKASNRHEEARRGCAESGNRRKKTCQRFQEAVPFLHHGYLPGTFFVASRCGPSCASQDHDK